MAMAMQSGACAPSTSGLGFKKNGNSDSSCLARITTRHSNKSLGTCLRSRKSRNCARFVVRAQSGTTSSNSGSNSSVVVAPWEFESPSGQFLVSLLQSHPHLFADAADQQIQQLAADKAAAAEKNISTSGSSDLVLYKRIAEVKEQERHKAVVEVMYSLVVQKFLAAGMSLIPKLSGVAADKQVDFDWKDGDEKTMISPHSPEVLEVVNDHLGMILGRPSSHPQEQYTLVQASKMRIGHLYAATVVFGYFLRRLDQRYQLDMGVKKALSSGSDSDSEETRVVNEDLDMKTDDDGRKLAAEASAAVAAMAASKQGEGGSKMGMGMGMFPWKPSKLKSYVMSMDQESVQRFSRLRCKESLDVVEKQTQVLFGKPEAEVAPDGSLVFLDGDKFVISLAGLRRLVLEAVAFGSFLWDAESYVDSRYNLVA